MTPEDKVRKADDTFYEIFHDLRLLHYINPVNHQEERDAFFERWANGRRTDPKFEYNLLPTTLTKSKTRLESLDFGVTPLEKCFSKVRGELLLTLRLLEARSTFDITARSIELYGKPDQDLVSHALTLLEKKAEDRKPKEESTTEVGIKGLEEALRAKLREDRIEGWDVVEDRFNVHLAHVDWAHHKIRLQPGMIVTERMLNRLAVHEVGVHVYRCVNGERQPYRTFAIGFDQYLETEEGLAVVVEDKLGLLTPTVLRRYAGRVLASNMAITQSFLSIFTELLEYFAPEDAYTLTQRSKRGICDTLNPGGFVQDHIYLSGKKKVETLLPNDLRLLYTGRIAVSHLPMIREMLAEKKIVEPAFVPEILHE